MLDQLVEYGEGRLIGPPTKISVTVASVATPLRPARRTPDLPPPTRRRIRSPSLAIHASHRLVLAWPNGERSS